MTTYGFLSVAPTGKEEMAEDVAAAIDALDDFDVDYETTPMGTTIEAPDAETLFEACLAAHEAVDADRVGTFLKVDDKRAVDEPAAEKVRAVEEVLGREAKRHRAGTEDREEARKG